jgi:hypothetical protein
MIIYPTWHDSYPELVEQNTELVEQKIDKINKKISSMSNAQSIKGKYLSETLEDFINKFSQKHNSDLKTIVKQASKTVSDNSFLPELKKVNPNLFSSNFLTTYTIGSLVTKELLVNNSMITDGKVVHPILEAVLYAQQTLDNISPTAYSSTIQYTTLTSNLDSYIWPSGDLINSISKKDFLYSLGIPIDHCYDIEYLNIDIYNDITIITVQKALPF